MEIPTGVPYRPEQTYKDFYPRKYPLVGFFRAVTVLLWVLTAIPLFPQSTDKTDGLVDLSEKVGTPGFFEELVEIYEAETKPKEALRIMQKFLPVLEKDQERYRLLLDMARIEEQTGRLEMAQLHYQSAAFAPPGSRDYRALYQSMLILIDLGDLTQAMLQARQIAEDSSDPELIPRAKVQQARILQLQGKENEALDVAASLIQSMENLPADVLYNVWLLYRSIEDHGEGEAGTAEEVRQILEEKFPDSPEYGMILGRVGAVPTVETSLGLRLPEPDSKGETRSGEVSESAASRAIQTGSFRDAENAAYMSRELEREGFTSVVVQADVGGRLYYRVLVPVAFGESEQELLLRLKEKGFEGNPVY
jgi:tetratricopeptide (TPR) repeat protein